jgi:prepilin-type N-terminal cleavage/methylation domain-containing protein/prepilin-type processing-associated H-X9-DG protein
MTKATNAFTLIELLIVIVIIALLIGILLPSLSGARQAARTTLCLSNQHSLGQAYAQYATDSKDGLVSSWTDVTGTHIPIAHPNSWIDWPMTASGTYLSLGQMLTATDVDADKRGIQNGALWPYLNVLSVYHCPNDKRDQVRTIPGAGLAYATYSMPNYLAGDDADEQLRGGHRCFRRLSQLWRPSENYATLEEADPRGMNIGSWVLRLNQDLWIDVLTVWHYKNGTIAYADGHASLHTWTDPRTINMSRDQQMNTDATNNDDFKYLRTRWDDLR